MTLVSWGSPLPIAGFFAAALALPGAESFFTSGVPREPEAEPVASAEPDAPADSLSAPAPMLTPAPTPPSAVAAMVPIGNIRAMAAAISFIFFMGCRPFMSGKNNEGKPLIEAGGPIITQAACHK